MTRQTAVAAHGSKVASPDLGDGGGSMWGSSGNKKTTGSFVKTSSSSSQLQLWRAVVTRAKVVAQFGSKIHMT
jgi:hypothetical protein